MRNKKPAVLINYLRHLRRSRSFLVLLFMRCSCSVRCNLKTDEATGMQGWEEVQVRLCFQDMIFMTLGAFVWLKRNRAVSNRACTREILSYVTII